MLNIESTHAEDQQQLRPVYFVFDCVYYNGQDITNWPLWKRVALLPEIVIKEYEEGIILKPPRSRYICNTREWYKFKPEYIAEWGDDLVRLLSGHRRAESRHKIILENHRMFCWWELKKEVVAEVVGCQVLCR